MTAGAHVPPAFSRPPGLPPNPHRPALLQPGFAQRSAVWDDEADDKAEEALRAMLAALGVQGAVLLRLQDLRRSHAKDLQEAGATLAEILAAGE